MRQNDGWDWDKALAAMPGRWTEVADELFSFTAELGNRKLRRVYDLGCGVGRHTLFLARQGFAVTASDVSKSAVAHTRRNLEEAGLEAALHQLDMSAWPFDDHSFDAVIAFNVVYHTTCSQLESVLAQIHRALVPEGMLFITFKSTADSDCGKGRKLARNTYAPTEGVEEGIAHYYVDADEVKRLLATFDLVSMVHKEEHPVSSRSERKRAHWVVWARKRSE